MDAGSAASLWKTNVLSGGAFGVQFAAGMAVFQGWLPPHVVDDLWAEAIVALVTGATFGFAIVRFVSSKTVAAQTAIKLPPGEIVKHAGGANHFRNMEARGGKLYLTNRHLVFQPHSLNLQGCGLSIPLSQIAGVARCMTLGIVPNGLIIMLLDGTAHRFVVNGRDVWRRMIMERRQA